MQWTIDDARLEARKLALLVNVTDDDTARDIVSAFQAALGQQPLRVRQAFWSALAEADPQTVRRVFALARKETSDDGQ